jgi:excisionase family DNA binding protein
MTTRLYTPDETAEYFGVGKATVLRWAREELIGCHRLSGTCVRFSDEHIAARTAGTDTARKPGRNPRYAS